MHTHTFNSIHKNNFVRDKKIYSPITRKHLKLVADNVPIFTEWNLDNYDMDINTTDLILSVAHQKEDLIDRLNICKFLIKLCSIWVVLFLYSILVPTSQTVIVSDNVWKTKLVYVNVRLGCLAFT